MANMFEKRKDEDFLDRVGLKADDFKGFLDQDVRLEGKLSLTGTFKCDAFFKGEINCEGLLILGESARVDGNIHSKQVSIQGRVTGSIHAEEKMLILQNAVVQGDIYTDRLVIESGATFDGTCHMPLPGDIKKESNKEGIPEPATVSH